MSMVQAWPQPNEAPSRNYRAAGREGMAMTGGWENRKCEGPGALPEGGPTPEQGGTMGCCAHLLPLSPF